MITFERGVSSTCIAKGVADRTALVAQVCLQCLLQIILSSNVDRPKVIAHASAPHPFSIIRSAVSFAETNRCAYSRGTISPYLSATCVLDHRLWTSLAELRAK
jgi:hypothetical protein